MILPLVSSELTSLTGSDVNVKAASDSDCRVDQCLATTVASIPSVVRLAIATTAALEARTPQA
jgi:uncharacterized membrane protein